MVEQSLTFVVLTSQAGQSPGTCNNPGMLSAITTTLTLARGLQRLLELLGFLPSLFLQKKRTWPLRRPTLDPLSQVLKPGLYLFQRRVS